MIKPEHYSEGDKRRIENVKKLLFYNFSYKRCCILFQNLDLDKDKLKSALEKTFINNLGYNSTISLIMSSISLNKEEDDVFKRIFMEGELFEGDVFDPRYNTKEFMVIDWMLDRIIRNNIKHLEGEIIKHYFN